MNGLDCLAADRGAPCTSGPVIVKPVPLCRRHLAEVVHQATQTFIAARGVTPSGPAGEQLIRRATVLSPAAFLGGRHDGAVYFLANGSRVKIGYSTNLKERISALALREDDIVFLLHGGMDLEKALHRRFADVRIKNTEWFTLDGPVADFIATHRPTAPRSPRPVPSNQNLLRYPDGQSVPRGEWPNLFYVFTKLCEEQGHATKDDLVNNGPFGSRDTVRRALDVWLTHGIQVRKEGRAEQFFIPGTETE
ncbi:GIY-YIG nuclease family protein [Kitasatospora sp. NPDC001683]